tara:strand:+ start:163 stop:354 length:192 start_codon:yes stop_codon:yes gene_type:complete
MRDRNAAKQVDSVLSEEKKVLSEEQGSEKKSKKSLNDDADDGETDTRIKQDGDTQDLESEPGT